MKAIIVTIASTCLRRMGLVAIACCLAIADAQGQVVVFSSLTTPSNGGGDILGGDITTGPVTTWAGTFTANGNFNLVDVKVTVVAEAGHDPTFNVFFSADVTGTPDSITRWRQIGFGLRAPAGGGVVTANSITTPIAMTSGNAYWVILTPANSQSRLIWSVAGSFPTPSYSEFNHTDPNFSFGDRAWIGQGGFPLQFQVDGLAPSPLPTPVPPSLILCLTGLAIVGLYQMRRKLIN
jgi:hypothetical protein